MDKSFSYLFEIIYKKYSESASNMGAAPSVLGFSKFMGFGNDGKPKAWKRGQWPSAPDCWLLSQKLGFSIEWLLTGSGEPFETEVKTREKELEAKVEELEAELLEANRVNRLLTTRLLVDGTREKAGAKEEYDNTSR